MTETPAALARARALVQPALVSAVDRLVPELRDPARYHFGWTDEHGAPVNGGGGKGLRPALAVLSAEAAGFDGRVGVDGAVAVELIHNFSLLHDDIIDGDVERRHRPTVWTLWSVGDAIIVGDALHALAVEVLLGDGTPDRVAATHRLAVGTSAMITGQSSDMTFATRSHVTFEDCVAMEANKTGALLSFSASVGAVLGGADSTLVDALTAYGASLGIAFQAVDDVLGIWGDPATTGKAAGNDLRERKQSMPVTAAMHSNTPEAARIAVLYRTENELSEADVAELSHLVDAAGGRSRTERTAQEYLERATAALAAVPLESVPHQEFVELAEFVVGRSH